MVLSVEVHIMGKLSELPFVAALQLKIILVIKKAM